MKLKPRSQSAGFINGALIIGIALIGVVVAAISMASSSSTTDISPHKAKAHAAAIVEGIRAARQDIVVKLLEDPVIPGTSDLTFPAEWSSNAKPVSFSVSVSTGAVPGQTSILFQQAIAFGRFSPEVCVEINKLLQAPDYTTLNMISINPNSSLKFAAHRLGGTSDCAIRAYF